LPAVVLVAWLIRASRRGDLRLAVEKAMLARWILTHVGCVLAVCTSRELRAESSACETARPHHRPWQMAQASSMRERGCCFIQKTGNTWDSTDDVSREECIRMRAGGGIDSWHHYQNERCSAVVSRCGRRGPC
jgi:hypothetical protein